MSKEEVFLRDIEKTRRTWKIDLKLNLEDQRWIYYLTAGSFVLLLIMNFIFPESYSIKIPYDYKAGFIGVGLTFFGTIFLLNFLFFGKTGGLTTILITLFSASLSVILLYFGIPLLFGFTW